MRLLPTFALALVLVGCAGGDDEEDEQGVQPDLREESGIMLRTASRTHFLRRRRGHLR